MHEIISIAMLDINSYNNPATLFNSVQNIVIIFCLKQVAIQMSKAACEQEK